MAANDSSVKHQRPRASGQRQPQRKHLANVLLQTPRRHKQCKSNTPQRQGSKWTTSNRGDIGKTTKADTPPPALLPKTRTAHVTWRHTTRPSFQPQASSTTPALGTAETPRDHCIHGTTLGAISEGCSTLRPTMPKAAEDEPLALYRAFSSTLVTGNRPRHTTAYFGVDARVSWRIPTSVVRLTSGDFAAPPTATRPATSKFRAAAHRLQHRCLGVKLSSTFTVAPTAPRP